MGKHQRLDGATAASAHLRLLASQARIPLIPTLAIMMILGAKGALAQCPPIPFEQSVERAISVPGETNCYTFSAPAGELVTVVVDPASSFYADVCLACTDSPTTCLETAESRPFAGDPVIFRGLSLPPCAGDSYALLVRGAGTGTGSYQVSLTNLSAKLRAPGQCEFERLIDGTISPPGETDVCTFSAPAGELVTVVVDPASSFYADVCLACTDGPTTCLETAESRPFAGDPVIFRGLSLPPCAGDSYALLVRGAGTGTGSYQVSLTNISEHLRTPFCAQCGELVQNEIAPPGDEDAFAFTARPGEIVTLVADPASSFYAEVCLACADLPSTCLETAQSRPFAGDPVILRDLPLPACSRDSYLFRIRGAGTGTGSYSFTTTFLFGCPVEPICVEQAAARTVFPTRGGNAGKVTLQIRGSQLTAPAEVIIRRDGAEINASDVTIVDPGAILATFDLRGAAPGTYEVVVRTGGLELLVPQNFEIQPGGAAELWVDVVGRNQVRVGQSDTFHIRYGNLGSVDTHDVVLIVRISLGAEVELLESLPVVEGLDWSKVPRGIEMDGSLVVPIWIYRIGAREAGEVPLRITFPAETWAPGTPFSISTELRQDDSAFARTGDLDDLSQSTTYARVREAVLQGVCALDSPPPGLCADRAAATHRTPHAIVQGGGREDLEAGVRQAFQLGLAAGAIFLFGMVAAAWVGGGFGFLIGTAAALGAFGVGLTGFTRGFQTAADQFLGTAVGSLDPNEKVGPSGVGAQRFVPAGEEFLYVVYFENIATATAPAQEVRITEQLNPDLVDLSRFSLGRISFGHVVVTPPPGSTSYSADVDLRPQKMLIVRVNGDVNLDTGLVTWSLRSIDPETGEPPEDPLAGFLPPNLNPPEGEGSVLFKITPTEGLPTGSEIRNRATIFFDQNPAIETPEWLNTLDNSAPVSEVLPIASVQHAEAFDVQWSGSDEGAGVLDYTIFVSENGGPFVPWLRNTTATSATFNGQPGARYEFYSVARDGVGNVESAPAMPDVVTTIGACVGDCDGHGEVTVDELLTMVNIVLGTTNVSHCAAGDANHDNEITIDEILTAVNKALGGCSG